MPSTSKSSGRKRKQQWQVKQPTTNWLELPLDIMANILCRVGMFDIFENVQKVCTTWHKICKYPAMWRVIYMDARFLRLDIRKVRSMCKHAVDRSQGQLTDITMIECCDDELLLYVAKRSSQLKRLHIGYCYSSLYQTFPEALKNLPLLEELSLCWTDLTKEAIETICHYCPMLKILKVNHEERFGWNIIVGEDSTIEDGMAIAIGKHLIELEHLELVGDNMSSVGLQAILDGCRNLRSLDLRECMHIDLEGDLGKRCSQQIKFLKLGNDFAEGYHLDGWAPIYENDITDDEMLTFAAVP